MHADRVRMTHPKLKDQPIEVAPQTVKGHKRAGWKVADDKAPARGRRTRGRRTTSQPPAGSTDDSTAGSSTTTSNEE